MSNLPSSPWTPSHRDYHRECGWWGSTMLKGFRENGARWANDAYVTRTAPASQSTAAMELGTVVHLLVGEPDMVESLVVVAGSTRASKVYKMQRRSSLQLVVSEDDWALACRCAEAILDPKTPSARLARAVLVDLPGVAELAHRWEYEAADGSRLPVKAKFDRLVRATDGSLVLVDLKTSRDIGPAFKRDYSRLGYGAQAALYRAGVENLTGETCSVCVVAPRTGPPFDVRFSDVSGHLDLGRRQIDADVSRVAECIATGEWLSEWERGITALAPSAWAERDFDRNNSREEVEP